MILSHTVPRPRPFFSGVRHAFTAYAALLLAFFSCWSCVLLFSPPRAEAAESELRRFNRAVFVLSRRAPEEAWLPVALPSGMERDDRTSALLHHSDFFFVFLSLARDLETLPSGRFPLAPHYAALAYDVLGRHSDAARCMALYMKEVPFNADDALFRMRHHYAAEEYTQLRDAAALWRKNDHSCNEERLTLIWGSWANQGNYREALYAALSSPCKGWYPEMLAARSRLLLGERKEALNAYASLRARYPEQNERMETLWNEMASRPRYP